MSSELGRSPFPVGATRAGSLRDPLGRGALLERTRALPRGCASRRERSRDPLPLPAGRAPSGAGLRSDQCARRDALAARAGGALDVGHGALGGGRDGAWRSSWVSSSGSSGPLPGGRTKADARARLGAGLCAVA